MIPLALTIAGSDSGGGAGIQADLRTFNAFGVFGASAITATTFQNPLEVRGVEPLSPEAVSAQIEAVEDVLNVGAAKTGMLFSHGIIHAIKKSLAGCNHPLIVDPVMVSTSRARLLRQDAVDALKNEILPICTWVTPNIPEAEILADTEIINFEQQKIVALKIYDKWKCGVIVKGGHDENDTERACDVVCRNGELYLLHAPRVKVESHADHGTGCTFSAAFTACVAKKMEWDVALLHAKAFVGASLRQARSIGNESNRIFSMYPPDNLSAYLQKTHLEKI